MAATKNNLRIFLIISFVLIFSLSLLSPLFALAENSYGECAYGNQTYQGNCPASTSMPIFGITSSKEKQIRRGFVAKEAKLLQKFLNDSMVIITAVSSRIFRINLLI